MNPAVTWVIAIAVTIFHIWASRRKAKYWYLGGVVPDWNHYFLVCKRNDSHSRRLGSAVFSNSNPFADLAFRTRVSEKERNGKHESAGYINFKSALENLNAVPAKRRENGRKCKVVLVDF